MFRQSVQIFGVMFAVSLLQSCKTTREPSINTSEKLFQGSYIYGHEVSSLQLCGSGEELWVVGEEEVLATLQSKYGSMTEKAYEPVYVSFEGNRLPKASDGFAADYSGQFELLRVVKLQKESICR